MTIASENNSIVYTGNGATVAFSFPYAFQAKADLVVIETVIATGVQAIKALTTDYTISGTTDGQGFYPSGGTVTALAAPASTVQWRIYRDPARTQSIDLVENDPLPAEVLEGAYDRAAMWAQRIYELVTRSLRQPEGDSVAIDFLPSKVDRASKYAAYDADGDPIAAAGSADATPISVFMATVTDDTTAAAARITLDASQKISSMTAETAPAVGDNVGLDDVSAAAERKMTLANLFKVITSFTTVDPAPTDTLVINDASDTNNAKNVTVTDLAGRTPWAKLTYEQTSGTGGGTTTGAAWTIYPLTENSDVDGIVTVAANVFTLGAGSYRIMAQAVFTLTNATLRAALRLRNTSDAVTAAVGMVGMSSDTSSDATIVTLPESLVTIAATKNFELQYYVNTAQATTGLGSAITSGENELYGWLTIVKVAD